MPKRIVCTDQESAGRGHDAALNGKEANQDKMDQQMDELWVG